MTTTAAPDAQVLTDTGRARTNNEDAVAAFEPADAALRAERGCLYVVADGMGGHAAGEVASRYAVAAIVHAYYHLPWGGPESTLRAAIRAANAAIYAEGLAAAERKGMGCTVVVAAVLASRATVANAGDSRAYLLRGDVLRQVSLDHSWVAEQLANGALTPAQAATHPGRNILTRNLGHGPEAEPTVADLELQAGDRLLLCTDGLWGPVPDPQLSVLLGDGDASLAAARLVDSANAAGGPDNIGVAVVIVGGARRSPPADALDGVYAPSFQAGDSLPTSPPEQTAPPPTEAIQQSGVAEPSEQADVAAVAGSADGGAWPAAAASALPQAPDRAARRRTGIVLAAVAAALAVVAIVVTVGSSGGGRAKSSTGARSATALTAAARTTDAPPAAFPSTVSQAAAALSASPAATVSQAQASPVTPNRAASAEAATASPQGATPSAVASSSPTAVATLAAVPAAAGCSTTTTAGGSTLICGPASATTGGGTTGTAGGALSTSGATGGTTAGGLTTGGSAGTSGGGLSTTGAAPSGGGGLSAGNAIGATGGSGGLQPILGVSGPRVVYTVRQGDSMDGLWRACYRQLAPDVSDLKRLAAALNPPGVNLDALTPDETLVLPGGWQGSGCPLTGSPAAPQPSPPPFRIPSRGTPPPF